MILKYLVLLTLIYFVYQYIFIFKKSTYIDILTLDCTLSFENYSATASFNIRYQTENNFINELDIFTDRTPVVMYAAS